MNESLVDEAIYFNSYKLEQIDGHRKIISCEFDTDLAEVSLSLCGSYVGVQSKVNAANEFYIDYGLWKYGSIEDYSPDFAKFLVAHELEHALAYPDILSGFDLATFRFKEEYLLYGNLYNKGATLIVADHRIFEPVSRDIKVNIIKGAKDLSAGDVDAINMNNPWYARVLRKAVFDVMQREDLYAFNANQKEKFIQKPSVRSLMEQRGVRRVRT